MTRHFTIVISVVQLSHTRADSNQSSDTGPVESTGLARQHYRNYSLPSYQRFIFDALQRALPPLPYMAQRGLLVGDCKPMLDAGQNRQAYKCAGSLRYFNSTT